MQVYPPGAGWAHFDPTNALRADGELIPVAIVRAPARASPISGRWSGAAGDYLGLKVDVSVVSRQAAES
ncbi:MAG: hypothetical protein IPK81_22255 [Rhodospirillales bacterium]|nr:MAG: hypothetical protein IPK81_22255 [Rhodospirillales bacterium]